MNISTLEEIINTKSKFTIYLCGHCDPLTIDRDRYKPEIDRKRKTLKFRIPEYACSREFIIDVNSIMYVEYYKY